MKVFVYGTLKKGYGNHRLLESSINLGPYTTKKKYTLLHLGGFPGLIKEPLSHIRGELYEVDDVVLKRLDWLEGHPDFYCREEIETFEDGTPIITYIFNYSPRQKYTILEEGVWP